MADKHLFVNSNGLFEEREFTTVSAGAANAGEGVALNDQGNIDETMLPPGIGAETTVAPASENLTAGDIVNFWKDGATLKVRKADASTANAGKRAHGFVTENVNSGSNATVYTDAGIKNVAVAGLTSGTEYFLSNSTPGGLTDTPPTTPGHCLQSIGLATSATAIIFSPGRPIIRA